MALLSARLHIGRLNAERLHYIGADTTAPTVPLGLVATPAGAHAITVTWNAATDHYGVVGYQVFHCAGAGCTTFEYVTSTIALTFTHSGLAPLSTHRYQVRAYDAASNISGPSAIATATTTALPPLTYVYIQVGGVYTDVTQVRAGRGRDDHASAQ